MYDFKYRIWNNREQASFGDSNNIDDLLDFFIALASNDNLVEGDMIFDTETGESLYRFEDGTVIDCETLEEVV